MAGKRISGITIEIGGDTTKLSAALKNVDSSIKTTKTALSDVEKLLKLDPSNTDLLAQKQKLLSDAISQTKERLSQLKTASEQAAKTKDNYDAWKAAITPLWQEIDKTSKHLENLKKEQERMKDAGEVDTDAYQALQKEIDETSEKLKGLKQKAKEVTDEFGNPISPEKYDALQREIVETEQDLKGLEDKSKDTGEAEKKLADDSQQAGNGLKVLSDAAKAVGTALAAAFAASSAAVAAFAASSVNVGKQFDASMAQVAATMGKTVGEIGNLRDFAQEMGAKTAFSASQAAEALNYMALAGYDAETSMQTLPSVLNLAAAGSMELATASDMITDSISALGLASDDASMLVDQMAAASSNANASVSQMGSAILTVGGTAKVLSGGMMTLADGTKQAYSSTTELNQAIGLLADNGIKGAEGGTALRNIILSLTAPTKTAAAELEKLGVSALDEAGNMRPLKDIFGDLNRAMSDLSDGAKTEVLDTIFNKTDLKSVNALLATNVERWDELAASIENSKFAAEKMADTQLDNLAGDVTLFQSALEGAQIAVSDVLMPSVREFVQFGTDGITRMTDAFKGANVAQSLAEGFRDAEGVMLPIEENAQKIRDQLSGFSALAPYFSFRDEMGELGEVSDLADGLYQTLQQLTYDQQQKLSEAWGLDSVDDLYAILDPVNELGWKWEKMVETADSAIQNDADMLHMLFPNNTMEEILSWLDGSEEGLEKLKAAAENVDASGITDPFSAAMEELPEIIENGVSMLMEQAPQFLEIGAQVLGAVAEGVSGAAPVFAENLQETIGNALENLGILGPVTEAFSGVGEAFDRIGEAISPLTQKFSEWSSSVETAQNASSLLQTSLTLTGNALSLAAGLIANIVEVGAGFVGWLTDGSAGSTAFKAAIGGTVTALAAFKAALAINTAIGTFGTVLKTAKTALDGAKLSMSGLNAVMAANPVMAVVTVLGLLVGAFVTAYTTSETFRNTVNSAFNAVKTTVGNVVKALVNFFTVSIPNAFNATIAKAGEVKDAIVNKFNEAVAFLASLPAKAYQWGSDLMNNFKKAITDNPITHAISGVAETVSSFLHHSTPDVGPLKDDDTWMPDMMRMFADGIQDNAYLVGNAAKKTADSVSNALSPVRDWAGEIGRYVSVDLANGIEKEASDAEKAAEKIASNIYNGLSKWADRTVKYERLSLKEQLEIWREIQRQFDEGSAQWWDARDKIFDIESKIATEQAQSIKDTYNGLIQSVEYNVKRFGWSTRTQLSQYEEIRDQFERNSEEWLAADEKVFDTRQKLLKEQSDAWKNYASDLKGVTDSVSALEGDYQKELSKRAGEIANSYKLFAEVPVAKEVSGRDLINNLRRQVNSIEHFYANLEKLSQRGVGDALVSEIRAMGVGASDELNALLSLSDKKLAEYASLYEEKQSLANSIAMDELSELRTETDAKIRESLDSIESLYDEYAPTIGMSLPQGLAEGIRNGMEEAVDAAEALANAVQVKFDALGGGNGLQSMSESAYDFHANLEKLSQRGVGDAFVDEIRAMGVGASDELSALLSLTDKQLAKYANLYEEKQNLANGIALDELSELRTETDAKIRESLDSIESLYDEYAPLIGMSLPQGLAEGIRNGMEEAIDAAEALANAVQVRLDTIGGASGLQNLLETAHGNAQVLALDPAPRRRQESAVREESYDYDNRRAYGLRSAPITFTVNNEVGGRRVAQLQRQYEEDETARRGRRIAQY